MAGKCRNQDRSVCSPSQGLGVRGGDDLEWRLGRKWQQREEGENNLIGGNRSETLGERCAKMIFRQSGCVF